MGVKSTTTKKRDGFVSNERCRIIKMSSNIKGMLTSVLGIQGHKVHWEAGSPIVTDL